MPGHARPPSEAPFCCPAAAVQVRQSAGLYLKNSLRQHYEQTDAALKQYIKVRPMSVQLVWHRPAQEDSEARKAGKRAVLPHHQGLTRSGGALLFSPQTALVPMLAHPQRALRHTAGSNISTIVSASGLGAWPELVGVLQQCLSSSDLAPLDGGLDTLFKVRTPARTHTQHAAWATQQQPRRGGHRTIRARGGVLTGARVGNGAMAGRVMMPCGGAGLPQVVEESPVQMEVSVPVPAAPGSPAPPAPAAQSAASSSLLAPLLLKLLQAAPSADVKRQAVAVLNLMARDMPAGIAQNLDA